MNELWYEAYPHRWFWHYDLLLIYTQFCSSCHRLIHAEWTNEREAGFHYNRNDSQISELESWMNFDLKLTHTGGSDTMIYHSFTRNFALLVTAWSIRSELAMYEKQGSTTTEMTAKSLNWSPEWILIWSLPTQLVRKLRCTTHSHAILLFLSPPDPYGAN